MKKLLLITCMLLAMVQAKSQTITTMYPPAATTFSTGLTYITFAIRNNNPYPVVLTNLTNLQANLYEDNVYSLFYSAVSLAGPPLVAAPNWTLAATSLPMTSTIITFVTPFECIGVTIPPMTTYRFALQGSKGTAVRGGVAPNIFSSGGIDLLVGNNVSLGAQVGYFGWQNLGNSGTAYFFDGSVTLAQPNAYTDIYVKNAGLPNTVCSGSTNSIFAQICNKSPNTINLATNNITVNYNITGPVPAQTPTVTLNTGTLAPCQCTIAFASGIDYTQPGTYYATATASIAGLVDNNLVNNAYTDSVTNYKPTVTPITDSVCQYSDGSLFAGFDASNCLSKTVKLNTNGTVNAPQQPDGASDATAALFATGTLPVLPMGAVITGGTLLITNLNGQPGVANSFGNEARFNIYGPPPNGPATPFLPGTAGSPLAFAVYNFDYTSVISDVVLNNMYAALGAGGTYSIGYWESLNQAVGADALINAQTLPTQVTLKINYTISPISKWYTANIGGSSILNANLFNPFVTPGSGLSNTNTVASTNFFAACSADSVCRVSVEIKVNPSPVVNQDSIALCELIPATGNSIFDLTTLTNNVGNNNPNVSVDYYQDQGLTQLINNPSNFNSASTILYSKVSLPTGCVSSDSIILTVHSAPEFTTNLFQPFACAPYSLDVASLIDQFSTVPPGTDTLYYTNNFTPHPNPHNITTADTVYIVFVTNTIPACTDTALAEINILPPSDEIANQGAFNISIPGSVGCGNVTILDGNTETLVTPNDCRKIATVTDISNGTSLGSVTMCEDIDASTQYHNGQPYVNRHYQITPTTQDTALVCLYYLDDDFNIYNADAIFNGWPQIVPNVNLAISKVDNGDINTPGHTAIAIPNANITTSYDPLTTVWTVCFPVSGFSYFYAHSANPGNVPLPVSLLSFAGKKIENTSLLQWITASEQNNSHFVLERSKDGKQFNTLSNKIYSKAINGNSATQLTYDFVDQSPLGGNNYYRLQQTDLDGNMSYSKVVNVYHGNETMVSLYPNPVNTQLNIEINIPNASIAQIKIMDATGRVVRAVDMQLQAGNNKSDISMEGLADGVYMIKITNNKGLQFSQTIRKN